MNRIPLRAAIVLVTACCLASLSACREKHEPVKPTVASAAVTIGVTSASAIGTK